MKRLIDQYLREWKTKHARQPLLLRGARQVGKTYAVRKLGDSFNGYVEINFEDSKEFMHIFDQNLDPERIIRDIAFLTKKSIKPGETLLFFDEIQTVPQAVLALRYFYEKMPELHIIAAGSLLDFAIEEVGVPVGRVEVMHVYPLSFFEFLIAQEEALVAKEILNHHLEEPMSKPVHEKILRLVAEYLALGGMPQIVDCWKNAKKALSCARIASSILKVYKLDFVKYAKRQQIKYVDLVFKAVPHQLGKKFKFSTIEGEFRKRDLSPALDLLETACIIHKVYYSWCQGFPYGAQVNPLDYKVLFLDVGLAQSVLKLKIMQWFVNPLNTLINKGAIVEAFVGQEMLAYSDPFLEHELYYWHREAPSQAEIDYVIQEGDFVIPIEVKGGTGKTLKSLHNFLESHKSSPYGIRFSTLNYSKIEKLHSYPLYAIAGVMALMNDEFRDVANKLIAAEDRDQAEPDKKDAIILTKNY